MYGTIEWLSWNYPAKRYQIITFTPDMYVYVIALLMGITDYHTITAHVRNRH